MKQKKKKELLAAVLRFDALPLFQPTRVSHPLQKAMPLASAPGVLYASASRMPTEKKTNIQETYEQSYIKRMGNHKLIHNCRSVLSANSRNVLLATRSASNEKKLGLALVV